GEVTMVRFDRVQRVLAFGISLIALATVQMPLAKAQNESPWRPLLLEGYNADVITDKNVSVRFAQPFDGGNSCWFEAGAGGHLDGLPAGQTINSVAASGLHIPFLIQPAVLPNVLQLRGSGKEVIAGTLELERPAAYSQLAIYASSGNGTIPPS